MTPPPQDDAPDVEADVQRLEAALTGFHDTDTGYAACLTVHADLLRRALAAHRRDRAELERVTAERDALRQIVVQAWNLAADGADYEGGMIQGDMVKAGLATVRPMTDAEAERTGLDEGGDWHEATPLGRSAMGWPT